ncbi:MAG: CCA tRNA nucleotidyltransferase [Bacteroidales bacterium]
MMNPEISGLFSEVLKQPLFIAASHIADEMDTPVFVIGGFVRDVLLNRPCQDIDFVVMGKGTEFAEKLAKRLKVKKEVQIFRNFGTAHFLCDNYQVEVVGARKESYRRDSRKPIVEDGTIEDDQNRRDFTINTLAIQLNSNKFGFWADPFGGLKDLANGIIRTPLDADITYSDDPLRIMRAIRFACQLDFTIEEESYEAIRRNAERINIVSVERVVDELNKIILTPKPSRGFIMLEETGILEFIFPQFRALKGAENIDGKGHKDNFYHTLQVVDNLALKTNDLWLRWAALLHDIAKPLTKKYEPETGWTFHGHEFKGSKMVVNIFRELKLPMNEKMKYVQKLVLLHLRPIVLSEDEVTDSAVRRLLFEASDDIDDLMLLCEADITSKNPEKVKRYLKNFELVRKKLKEIEEKDRIRNWQPPVTGEMIMNTFGIEPSLAVGIIKTAIREAILDGIIPNEYDAAYKLMLKEGEKLGLKKVD